MATHFFVNEEQVKKAVDDFVPNLGKDVAQIFYTIKEDSGGEPAIYFRVVLSNAADSDASMRIRTAVHDELRPYQKWGVYPYLSFRSEAEQPGDDPNW